MILSVLLAVLVVANAEFKPRPIPEFARHLTGQALVDYLKSSQPLFKAGIPKMSYEQFKSKIMDAKYLEKDESIQMATEIASDEEIPESFDAREKWPECNSIKLIRDQANCGSCWAVSAASAMSDRVCIQSKGAKQTLISDADILSCCGKFCGYGYV
ncbi:unnamed protein product [Strongylus vulgaris]|uniref:Peptidase C1A papain C-terminal domain-containing protein n=1 Tax=Strongylus vulgaris TaxID=40348 RepID=A0A3P7JNN8_STRVU|nr:unnamed protein product [Strongylus vulgaris]